MWVCFLLLWTVFSGCHSSDGGHHDNSPSAMMMGATQSTVVGPNPEPARDQNQDQDQDKEEQWKQQLLDLLSQLVQAQRQTVEGQAEVIKMLGTLGSQGLEQIQNLQNLARHQSLLVENHQALLLQTSRIATQLQDFIKKPSSPSK